MDPATARRLKLRHVVWPVLRLLIMFNAGMAGLVWLIGRFSPAFWFS